MKNTMPKFYMTVGLPASGKSTLAEIYKDKLDVIVHSSDAIRAELGDINDQSKNTDVFQILHQRIKDDLKDGKNVVYDATNLSRKRRIAFLNELCTIPCEKICVLFATPYELCLARNFARDRQVPEDVMTRMYKNFETPWFCEGWDYIQIVWADYKKITDCTYSYLADLDKYCSIPHDNPNHTLSIGEHMLKASSYYETNFCEISEDYSNIDNKLNLAILMHDCGKPDTKAFLNSKGEPSSTAHYYQHHCIGSYKALFYLKEIHPNWTDEDILYISLLINLHMRPFLVWRESEQAKEKDVMLFGNKIINDVSILHECDVAAH